jgi:nickel-type superoxide dismutase maturation protease
MDGGARDGGAMDDSTAGRAPGQRGGPLLRVAVAEHSMLPTLRPGDWLLARRTRRIRPGQVVLAWHPRREGLLLVKRAARRAEGGWWLSSDFPEAPGATDSAAFGAVAAELIVGRVLARYYPVRAARWFPPGPPPRGEGITT